MTLNNARTNPQGPTWDQTSAYRRAVVAEQQVDALTRECKALRELVAAQAPVVDAALIWHQGSTETNPSPGKQLAVAVVAYLNRG